MVRLTTRMIGSIAGRIGDLVTATHKGVHYVRIAPKRRKKKVSPKELANRKKFAPAQQWLKPVKTFVRAGFKRYSPTVEGFVAAKSYLLKHAFAIMDDKQYVDPARVLVSFGDLPLPLILK